MSAARVRGGFSLLEVLVALAIVGFAVAVLASGYANILLATRQAETGGGRAADLALAREALLLVEDREDAEKGDEIGLPDGERLRWKAEIEPTEVADLFRVRLVAEFSGRPGDLTRVEETQELWLLRPGWGDPVEQSRLREAFRKAVEEARR